VPIVSCPACGEDEELTGARGTDADGGSVLLLTCQRCQTTWERDARPRCRLCGSEDLEAVPTSTLEEHGRGEQRTPSGIRIRHYCWTCRGDDVTSQDPRPGPQPHPGGTTDPRGLRRRGE